MQASGGAPGRGAAPFCTPASKQILSRALAVAAIYTLAALAVAALAAPAPSDLREATPTPKAREPTFAPSLAPCDAGFVPTCKQAKGFGLCDSANLTANAACNKACVVGVKMTCPMTCSLSNATSGTPSDYGNRLPPAATAAICSTCAAKPDLPCCRNQPHEGKDRRRPRQLGSYSEIDSREENPNDWSHDFRC